MRTLKNQFGIVAAGVLVSSALMMHTAMAQNALPAAPTAPAPATPKLDLKLASGTFLPPLRPHSSSTFTPLTEPKIIEKPLIQVPDKLKGVVKWPTVAGVQVKLTSRKFGGAAPK